MYTVMLGLLPLIFAEDTSPILLHTQNLIGFIVVRVRGRSKRFNLLDLGSCPFLIIFDLNCGQ